jgi:ankyrin repeat protein
MLVESGADVNTANNDGETALHLVAGNPSAPYLGSGCDSDEKAKALIHAGADIEAKAKSGKTPLDYAVDSGRETVEKVLREMVV